MTRTRVQRWAAAGAAVTMAALVGACSQGGELSVSRDADVSSPQRLGTAEPARDAMVATPGGGDAASVVAGQASTRSRSGGDRTAAAGSGGATAVADGDAQAQGQALPQAITQQKIVRTATLRIEVEPDAFQRQFSRAATIASSLGGFVASSTSAASSSGDGANQDETPAAGTLVLRVPADRFDDARRQLRELGTVTSEEIRGEDVGAQLTDIDARLRNLRAQEEAIRALMAKAKDVAETLAVQNQLGNVREQIEQLAAQQARLSDAAALSTITVEIAEPGAITDDGEQSRLARAFHNALEGAANVLAGTIVVLGYLVPLGLLALAIVAAVATALRRQRKVHQPTST